MFFYLTFLWFFGGGSAAWAVSLDDAYRAALQKSESPQVQASQTEIQSERVSQGWGTIMPRVSFNGSYQRQDSSASGTNGNILINREQTVGRFTVNQPLFRGLSDFAELRARKARFRAQEASQKYQLTTLYQSVASAYYQVVATETDLNNLNALLELSSKRVGQLKQRARIGRSRRGELLAAEAQVATLQAQRESLDLELIQSREALQLVSTIPANAKLEEITESGDPQLKPFPELEKGLQNREDLVSRREEAAAADSSVSAFWGQHLPTLDFIGNYYVKRPDALESIKWDFGLQLSVPIFNGGVIQSQIREAAEVRKQADLALALAERTARQDLKVAYDGLKSAIAQRKALKEALTISEANYKEQNKDYQLGLVTNLEVISALNQMYETKRLFDRTRYRVRVAQITLDVASGSWKEPK